MKKLFNVNFFHNVLNVVGLVVGALLTMDWTMFGLPAEQALFVGGCFILADKIIKLSMNIARDGLTGLAKVQPPVESEPYVPHWTDVPPRGSGL